MEAVIDVSQNNVRQPIRRITVIERHFSLLSIRKTVLRGQQLEGFPNELVCLFKNDSLPVKFVLFI